MADTDLAAQAWQLSLRLLAMREHSQQELLQKVQQRFALDAEQQRALIERLLAANYLSDERFATVLVRSLIGRGCGGTKILHQLRQKGIDSKQASALLMQLESEWSIDWADLAHTQRVKKFGSALPSDFKERARQTRFLLGRGFDLDSINAVFHEKC